MDSLQKQPSSGVLKKTRSENKQEIYRIILSAISLRHGCSLVNLLHIIRTTFPKNTSGGMLLSLAVSSSDDSTLSNFLDSLSRLDVILPKRASKDSINCHFLAADFKQY